MALTITALAGAAGAVSTLIGFVLGRQYGKRRISGWLCRVHYEDRWVAVSSDNLVVIDLVVHHGRLVTGVFREDRWA